MQAAYDDSDRIIPRDPDATTPARERGVDAAARPLTQPATS
jgi:hypothetical protein